MDPGYLKREFKLMHLLENFHSDDICARCEVLTTPRSHHCNIDDRCIERWDHHCPWINNCVGVRNSGYFMVQLFTTFLLLLMYIEPPITDLVLENHGHVIVNKYYMMLCVYCYSDKLFIPIYVATILIALVGFLVVGWVMWSSCSKFARDGAQLAEEEDGNLMHANNVVNNRIGKTQRMLTLESDELTQLLVSDHEKRTMRGQ